MYSCQENHPDFARFCCIYKREKENLEVKHRKEVSFPETRKIILNQVHLKQEFKATETQGVIGRGRTRKPKHH